MEKLILVGASGHGKVIADIAFCNGYKDIVFLDDDECKKECAGLPVVGRSKDIETMDGDKFISIGCPKIRQKLMENIKPVTLIHPGAIISRRVEIGEGSVVVAGAVINSDTKIGRGAIINTGCSVDHDCIVGDFVHVSVGAHVSGSCVIGDRTWICAGATVSNNVNICNDAIIGAGAVVVDDIEIPGTYVGVPARLIKT